MILRQRMGEQGHRFLMENYTVKRSYEIIMARFETKKLLQKTIQSNKLL